jgi:hypothetical protein
MPTDVYEVVGAIDPAAAESLGSDDATIFVDDGSDEYLIARPRDGDGDE